MTAAFLKIRPYAHHDEAQVVALWRVCGLTRPWNSPYRDIARKLTVQSEWFLVGEIEGGVVASVMAGYDGHRGWINYLAVDPAWQKRGYGRALMAAAQARLLAAGCPKVNLQIRRDNAAVQQFYASMGFAPDDVLSLGKRLIPDTEEQALG
ncbi:GNAT family acetyltransferase [Bordetella avium]|uniref:Acetyltransferase n=1 Tax=Bordetella avium (strain 197N) TaxID=360910 RepID=Q2KW12_BORA1|nr:GNAT family acetyltransferase [Bordetella avium]AZY51787.1 GNAT family acetyltransferase [Bordetella avium]RIQ13350.1 GNAT family acetyltransferase [Bordetella avium]RIQ16396.1 GNAT family acetyltransferase [Bordetella avium]RIQ31083.1 GNAT family acetyltransferase [Bordetella avium]RIQ35822.1 GNAT family acetyltransferase [Bordetella avium]